MPLLFWLPCHLLRVPCNFYLPVRSRSTAQAGSCASLENGKDGKVGEMGRPHLSHPSYLSYPSQPRGLYSVAVTIDLNADVGEGVGDDHALLKNVTSANIACGLHAGGPNLMRRTVQLARGCRVSIGAHPGFPDREGFGRREMNLPRRELEDIVLYQVAALSGIAEVEGTKLHHVKAHGALYNIAARNHEVADAVIAGVRAFNQSLLIVALPDSELSRAADRAGMRSAAEAFADRAYRPDGSLVPRQLSGAVIHDPELILQRALRLVRAKEIVAIDGSIIHVAADTICVHGDTPQAAAIAARLRNGFTEAGITCAALI
jgi:UPF0271 protein